MSNIMTSLGGAGRLFGRGCGGIRQKHNERDAKEGDNAYTDKHDSCVPGTTPHFRVNDTYQHLKDLVESEEGQCCIVRSKTSGRLFVAKHTRALSIATPTTSERTGRRRRPIPYEAQLLQRIQSHPNIIRYFSVGISPLNADRHLIFLEFCSGGDLLDQLRTFQARRIRTPETFTLHVLVGLAQALAYIHHGLRYKIGTTYDQHAKHEPLIHGDIKPENVFLRWPSQECGMPEIVLADFGMAQVAAESRGITGTPGYDAPEVREVSVLRNSAPAAYERRMTARIMTTKSDMYQFGLLLHLLATGSHFEVGDDTASISLPLPHQSITGLVPLIIWCLQTDPVDRPECTGDLEHGILNAVDMFRKKRDSKFAMGSEVDEKMWNISELKDECV